MISSARLTLVPLVLAASAMAAESGSKLVNESPFASRGAAAVAAPANETIEFAGVSLVGKKTDLVFYDKTLKKNHWISEGETKEGIAVLRYDSRREQAVIKLNGVEKILDLRKGSKSVGSPAPVPTMPVGFNAPMPVNANVPAVAVAPAPTFSTAPAMPAPPPLPGADAGPKPTAPATPETQVKQETEARMLVSDLLEIGMAQRKAYEEAQRKAAEGTPPPNPTQPLPGAAPAQPTKPNGQ